VTYESTDRRGIKPEPCECGRSPMVQFLAREQTHVVVCEPCNLCVSREGGEAQAIIAWNFQREHGAVLQ